VRRLKRSEIAFGWFVSLHGCVVGSLRPLLNFFLRIGVVPCPDRCSAESLEERPSSDLVR
jgi:hypothetical protein